MMDYEIITIFKSGKKSLPCAPSIVAFTVDRIFSCVPIVGIRSQT